MGVNQLFTLSSVSNTSRAFSSEAGKPADAKRFFFVFAQIVRLPVHHGRAWQLVAYSLQARAHNDTDGQVRARGGIGEAELDVECVAAVRRIGGRRWADANGGLPILNADHVVAAAPMMRAEAQIGNGARCSQGAKGRDVALNARDEAGGDRAELSR